MKRRTKYEYLILDTKGVIVSDSKAFQDVYGAKTPISELKRKYDIKKLGQGYLIPWDCIENRYNELNKKYEDIKKKLELISLIRMKRDENFIIIDKSLEMDYNFLNKEVEIKDSD